MKKVSLLLALTMLLSIFAAMPVVQADETETFVDYSGWIANAETASAAAGQKWTSTSSYSDFVVEFDVKIDSFLNSAINPKIWFTVRNSTTSASAFYVQNTTIVGETSVGDRNTANWNGAFSNGNHGMDTAGEVHTFRIFAIGKDVVLDEKVDGSWVRVGEMNNEEKYTADAANGTIVFSAASANIIVSNATVYTKPDETDDFIDYSDWDATQEANSAGTDQNWRTSGLYSDFVIEFDVKIDSFINNATNPKIWFDVREKSSSNSSSFYVQNANILGEAVTGDRNSNTWAFNNTDHGMDIAGKVHTFRIFAIGKDLVLDEKIGGSWVRVGAMRNENYSSDYTGGKFRVGGSSAYIWVSNATVYTKPEEVEVTPFVDYSAWALKEEVASASCSVDASTKWVSSGSYDDFVMEYTISATGNAGFGVWYNFRMNSGSPSRMFAQAGSLVTEKTWGGYNYETMSTEYGILGTSGAEHKMRISVIGSVYTVEEYVNGAWVRVGEYTDDGVSAAGPVNFGGHQAGTTFTLKDVKIYQYVEPVVVTPFVDYSALTAKESLASLSCAADHANSTYIKYSSTNNYENFVMEYTVSIGEGSDAGYGLWLMFRQNSGAARSYITYAAQFDVNAAAPGSGAYDYENISKEYGILGDIGSQHIMRVSAIGKKYTFEEKVDGNWVRVGEFTDNVESASGQIVFSGYAPSGKSTLFTLSDIAIYELESLTAVLSDTISSISAGSTIKFTTDRAVADLPETVAITDGVNSFTANVAKGSTDTEIVITLTQALDWSTEYTVDLSEVKDAYGIGSKPASFITPDEPSGYIVSDAVFYLADGSTVITSIQSGTVKTKRSVTKIESDAASKVTLVTALYKQVGGVTYMVTANATESSELALGSATDVWGEVVVPNDGGAYFIRTFVWQDLENCNPVSQPSDL